MGLFNDLELGWKDQKLVIPSDRILRVAGAVEERITFLELAQMFQQDKKPFVLIAGIYSVLLRCAGVDVTDEEVYEWQFTPANMKTVMKAIQALLQMMVPLSARNSVPAAGDAPGNSGAARSRSSKRSTRRQS